jgi:hypothetical protein
MRLSITDTQHNNALLYAGCHYAECHILFIVMLSVVMLSVVAPEKHIHVVTETSVSIEIVVCTSRELI